MYLSSAKDISQDLPTHTGHALALAGLELGGGQDAVGDARERQALQEDLTGAGESRQEEAFAAEERVGEAADELDVVVDVGVKCHQAARVDAQGLACGQVFFDARPASVYEGSAITLKALQDETLTTEDAGANTLGERDLDLDAVRRAQEGILLAQNAAAEIGQLDGDDFARIGAAKAA